MKMSQLPSFSAVDTTIIVKELLQLLQDNRQKLEQLLAQTAAPTWENLLDPLEDLEDRLHRFWSPIHHLNAVANTPALREAYNAGLPLLTDYQTELGHNQALYHAVQQIADSPAYADFNSAQKMVIKHFLRDFKLSGISLPPAEKQRFSTLSKELSQLGTRFEENVLDATEGWYQPITNPADLQGIPEIAIHAAQAAAAQRQLTGWVFTLEGPSYLAIMLHADSPRLRQDMYTAFVTRASDQGPQAGHWDNTAIMQDMLVRRLEKAKLLGFQNFAELSLVTKMVHSPQQVLDFLHRLLAASKPKAQEELNELKNFAAHHTGQRDLQPWDLAYYGEKLRQQRYAISQDELRAYFPAEKVLSGLFRIVNRLFGIRVEPIKNVETWHPDVRCYAMFDRDDQLRSYFYMDLYARQNKRGGAWMDEYCVRRRLPDGSIQIPVAYLTCNFQAPVTQMPSLLTHEEVQTLFHEFGHCLQHMLTQVDYTAVSGINGIPWDAVEVASQFLENWVWEWDSLQEIAEHYLTRQPLPEELFQRMQRAKNFQQGMQMLRQIELALFDFKLHIEVTSGQSQQIQQILDDVRGQTALIPAPSFNRFQNSFAHIFGGGYAAGYYSYKWAEVMASDAFDLFLEKGIFDPATSQKFLHTFLESGGAVEPADLFIEFRGRPPQVDALLRQCGIIS
jgi:oligopeptidase A